MCIVLDPRWPFWLCLQVQLAFHLPREPGSLQPLSLNLFTVRVTRPMRQEVRQRLPGQSTQAMEEISLCLCSLHRRVLGEDQQLPWLLGWQQKTVDSSRASAIMKVSTHCMTPG